MHQESPEPQDPPAPSTKWVLPMASVAALMTALLVSSQIQLSMMDHGHSWWRLFLWQLSGWGFWAFAARHLLESGHRLQRPDSRPPSWLARETATVCALVLLHVPLVAAVFTFLQPFTPVDDYTFSLSLLREFRSWVQVDLLIYAAGVAIGYGLASSREARRAELRESRLETELARAQLEALRLRIQPHFLFNTLHSIAVLVRRQKNDRALEMILGLSDLLRATLELSRESVVPLREELDFARLYLDLQGTRFADRLTVGYDIAEECLDQSVPPLILQPLIENAIRHGISGRAAPGRIELRAHLVDDRLHLAVTDDGVGLPEDFELERDVGVGLGNTRSRIRRLYGDQATLLVRPRERGGTIASITLPAEPGLAIPLRRAVG